MQLALSIVPIVLLLVLMIVPARRLRMPLPAHLALPAVALLAYALQLLFLGPVHESVGGAAIGTGASTLDSTVWFNRVVHAAAVDGGLSALTPLAIVFGAVLLFKTMEESGATGVLTARLRSLTPDPVAQLVLVGWVFSFLIEGLSGFGTPAALAAPLLVGLGFPMLRVAAMCLVMNSVPVSFGAVGTPTWFGLGGLGLTPDDLGEIGWRTAVVHTGAAPVIAVLALRIVLPWREISARFGFVLLAVAASVGPFLLTARFSVEFPSIVGGLTGLVGVAALARWRIGLPADAAEKDQPSRTRAGAHFEMGQGPSEQRPMSLTRAATPLAATVLLLAITRIDAFGLKSLLIDEAGAVGVVLGGARGLGEAWISPSLVVGLKDILGTGTAWEMPLLYVPFILPFVVVAVAAIPLLRMKRASVVLAWTQTTHRLARPAVALIGALVLTKMIMLGGDNAPAMVMGRAMADAAGHSWPYFAALLGALGSFFSGSNTVSNLTFAPIQAAIAGTSAEGGLDLATILALQSVGGAMGNMVCIHNIVAVAAVLGLAEKDSTKADSHPSAARHPGYGGGLAAVLRLTAGPVLAYALVAAVMAEVLAFVY